MFLFVSRVCAHISHEEENAVYDLYISIKNGVRVITRNSNSYNIHHFGIRNT